MDATITSDPQGARRTMPTPSLVLRCGTTPLMGMGALRRYFMGRKYITFVPISWYPLYVSMTTYSLWMSSYEPMTTLILFPNDSSIDCQTKQDCQEFPIRLDQPNVAVTFPRYTNHLCTTYGHLAAKLCGLTFAF